MKKFLMVAGSLMMGSIALVGCGGKVIETPVAAVEGSEQENAVKIGLVVGTGGLGDQNFNDLAYAGLKKAEEEFGITLDYVEPQAVSDFETFISQFAQDGTYDLIAVTTNEAQAALEKVAANFPDQKFSIVDTTVNAPNVKSILKDFSEMTFLNGYLAGAMTTDTSIPNINEDAVVGIVLGKDIPNMQKGALGFTAGAKLANPEVEVLVGTVGSFGDPAKGKEITKSMYDKGADIVLNFAGGSGLGVISQAEESSRYAMGGASNQNAIAPSNIPASAIEDLTQRMYNEVVVIMDDTWTGGEEVAGLKENAVNIVYDGSEVVLPQAILDGVEAAREKLVNGEIAIPATIEEVDAWVQSLK